MTNKWRIYQIIKAWKKKYSHALLFNLFQRIFYAILLLNMRVPRSFRYPKKLQWRFIWYRMETVLVERGRGSDEIRQEANELTCISAASPAVCPGNWHPLSRNFQCHHSSNLNCSCVPNEGRFILDRTHSKFPRQLFRISNYSFNFLPNFFS